MYYRYKTKNNSSAILKYGFLALLIAVLAGIVIHNRQELMFWKYSFNRLDATLEEFEANESFMADSREAEHITAKVHGYAEDNPYSEDACYLAARLHTLLGERLSNLSVTRYIISPDTVFILDETTTHFFTALKNIKKGFAIRENGAREDSQILLLAKLYLYTGYYDRNVMFDLMRDVSRPEELSDVEERRLYGFLTVLGGDTAYGLDFIRNHGSITSIEDRLFLAGVYKLSEQYTDAILAYKDILSSELTAEYEMTARMALGEIYYTQALYNEALEQFSQLLISNKGNKEAKQYMVRIYDKLGDTKTAENYM